MSAYILLVIRLALIVVLYAFLGWSIYTLWKSLKQTSYKLAAPQIQPIILTRIGEPDYKYMNQTLTTVMIGRDPASDYHLEENTISAHHARLSYHHGQWWLEDMRSRNGTYLNQLLVQEPMVVTNGDQVKCGDIEIQIHIA